MLKIKKFAALLPVLALTVGLAGCEADSALPEAVSEVQRSIVQSEADGIEPVKMKTIEPPEDGWTLDLLNEVVYLNGQHITFPFKLSDLDEDYDLREDGLVNYKNQNIFRVIIDENNFISSLGFAETTNKSSIPTNELIFINGLSLGEKAYDLFISMGSPDFELLDEKYSAYVYYLNNDANANINFVCRNDEVISITLTATETK
jgi:hypothetical protein